MGAAQPQHRLRLTRGDADGSEPRPGAVGDVARERVDVTTTRSSATNGSGLEPEEVASRRRHAPSGCALNAGVALAVGMLLLRDRLMVDTVLGLLLSVAGLLALLAALTVGPFGVTEERDGPLVPQTVVVDALAVVMMAIATVVVFRALRDRP